jgi:surface carbohydrate biosynthesis protein
MSSKWLYLPIELKVRDLHSRILLASFAALKGIKSIVGHKLEIQHKMREFPLGVFLMYGFANNYLSTLEKIIQHGHKIVAQDDEGLVVWQNDMYQKFRVSSSVLEKVSQVYAWGPNQKQLIDTWSPKSKEKILVTGSPRFDLLRKPFIQALDVDVQNIKNKFGSYILVNTNFGRANHFKGTQYYIHTKKEQYVSDDKSNEFFEGCLEFQKIIYNNFIEMMFELSSIFPEKTIIIRPHPSENHDAWRKHTTGLSNVKVIHDGCVLPWILASEVLIHNGCTTGVEAYMLNKPVISYRPEIDEIYEAVLPNQLSHQVFTKKDLISATKSYLAGSKALRTPEMETIANFYIESIESTFASEKIIDELSDNLKQIAIDEKRELYIYNNLISNSAKAVNSKSMLNDEYIKHKFSNLSINEVCNYLQRLKQADTRFSKVTTIQISETCFLFESASHNKNFKKTNIVKIDSKSEDNENKLQKNSVIFSSVNHQVSFGYYDVTPFSPDESKLLAMHAPLENATPSPKSHVKIGFYDLKHQCPEFQAVDTSSTWCWQMGCRLQWYPAGGKNAILYNKIVNGKYGCVIQDIYSKNILKEYSFPIYSVSPNGRWGLSLNFSRLQRFRPGYGYSILPDVTTEHTAPDNDGIWIIDLNSGEHKLILSLKSISEFHTTLNMSNSDHYFNHILFSPNNIRFMFFHLWVNKKGLRKSRLFTCNIDGSELHLLNEGENTSHYTWKSDNLLLATSTHNKLGLKYYLYEDKNNFRTIYGHNKLNEDGHPTFIPQSNNIITDTYPDSDNYRKILYFDALENDVKIISKHYSPPEITGELRCDLHPRLSNTGDYLCFDTFIKNKRSMVITPITNITKINRQDRPSISHITSCNKVENLTVIIRSVGERTESYSEYLVKQQVPQQNIIIVHKSPFSEALRESFKIGIDRGLPWTVCIDADILIKPNSLQELLSIANRQRGDIFEIQGQILDKFFGGPRDGGPHMYRTSLLSKAIDFIPEEGSGLRPENSTILKMKENGYPHVQIPLVLGLHDFEQNYRDIFRKCYVQAHKHSQFIERFINYWRLMADEDKDFQVALWGLASGIARTNNIRVDVQNTPFDFYEFMKGNNFIEKDKLDHSTLNFSVLEAEMLKNFKEKKFVPIFPTTYFDCKDLAGQKNSKTNPDKRYNCNSKTRLKIVHINTQDTPGGAAKSTSRLAEAQRKQGYQSDILVGTKKSNHPSVHRFDPEPSDNHTKHCLENGLLYYEYRGSHKIVNHHLVRNADLIHFQNLHGGYFNPFSIPKISKIKPIVWTLRDMQSITGHCAHSLDCNRWKTGCGQCPDLKIYPQICTDSTARLWKDKRKIYSKSKIHIVCPSQWIKSIVENSILSNQPIDLIYNSVDTDIFFPHDKTSIRRELGLPEDCILIGAVAQSGSLSNPWKGGEYTIEALKYLWEKYPKLIFVNIGASHQKPSPDHRIVNISHVDDERFLSKLYSSLDLFLYTTLADTCPLVIIEALSCGLPVVSFATGGVPELVTQGVDGFVTPKKNVRSLVKAAETLLKFSQLRNNFSCNARENAIRRFSISEMVNKYEKIYIKSIEDFKYN